ncbi:hypothetical protein TNIN_93251 [Trichonephila inaurata madagascariensis]|uniref:Uncharacterized protein n=1 Tax=Trichonephila inaurata madagascariensis TaxID=2747483 RepID=A0A8X7C4E8_9ARAC|nr:hypothetical protein TNIN_93251 [Trichonephila inaurata madagascariensis]
MYGTTLRLPYDLFTTDSVTVTVSRTYITNLISIVQILNLIASTFHGNAHAYLNSSRETYVHVFFWIDNARPPIIPPFSKPLVISQTDKNALDLKGKQIFIL